MASLTATSTRPLRRPRRLDSRAVFGLLLLLVATGGSIAFWTSSSDTRAVLVATRDLPAGATIGPNDLAVSRVHVDDSIYQASVPADASSQVVGHQVAGPVYAQQLLVRAQLSTRPGLSQSQVALTIAVSPDTAVGGRLHVGDAVEVLVTTGKGTPDERTTVVVPHVTVYDVGYQSLTGAVSLQGSSASASGDQISWVTVVATPEQAVELARAKWAGEIDLALLPPK